MKKIIVRKINNKWEIFLKNINIKQKIFLSVFVPILLFFISYTISNIINQGQYARHWDWSKTWYVWFIFLISCGYFEYKLL
jgi:hypothetical protein